MSDAGEMALNAGDLIEALISDMLKGGYPDNDIALGTLSSGKTDIQVQLKVTTVKTDFLDEG